MSSSYTQTTSYTVADIENVLRTIRTDLVMIASSSGAITEDKAREYAADVEMLVKNSYLRTVDITLMVGTTEFRAAKYSFVDGDATGAARAGGVRWPRHEGAWLRIILSYTSAYTGEVKEKFSPRLKIKWVPSSEDTTQMSLNSSGGRSYSSNGFGADRKDFQ